MFTIFNMLDRAAELNGINNRTYASINEVLGDNKKEQSIPAHGSERPREKRGRREEKSVETLTRI